MSSGDGRWKILMQRGVDYLKAGQPKEALPYFHDALSLARGMNNKNLEMEVLTSLGHAYNKMVMTWDNSAEDPIPYYQEAAIIAHDLGDYRYEAWIYLDMGDAYHNKILMIDRKTVHELALSAYRQVLIIGRDINNRLIEGLALADIGNTYVLSGKYSLARDALEKAMIIAKELRESPVEQDIEMIKYIEFRIRDNYPNTLKKLQGS